MAGLLLFLSITCVVVLSVNITHSLFVAVSFFFHFFVQEIYIIWIGIFVAQCLNILFMKIMFSFYFLCEFISGRKDVFSSVFNFLCGNRRH